MVNKEGSRVLMGLQVFATTLMRSGTQQASMRRGDVSVMCVLMIRPIASPAV